MITLKDKHWFQFAIEIAKNSECKFRHGCVIVKKNRPISARENRPFNHSLKSIIGNARLNKQAEARRSRNETFHAEARAIIAAHTNLSGSVLYSARVLKDDRCANSAPCESCAQIIEIAGINTVVFFENGELRKIFL